jgi:pyochelin biosynthesis protein PchC
MTGSSWLRRYGAFAPGRATLVCFPHAGGSASLFFGWAAGVAAHLNLLAVQYPGRQDRRGEPFVESITALADLIAAEVVGSVTGPLLFFGHSMGATVAFETARRIEALGGTVAGIFASARRAPSHHRPESLHTGSDADIIAELLRLDGTAASLLADDDAVRMILPAVRNDYRAIETYRCAPGAVVRCPITVLAGDQDAHLTEAEARRWSQHTTGRCSVRLFRGGHFYLIPHRRQVIELILDHMSNGGLPGGRMR